MDDPTLCASVLERFPEWSERISQLVQTDADFYEMCADYEELANWLEAHSDDECAPESDCIENRQLQAELEAEILAALQAVELQSPSSSFDQRR